MIDTKILTEEQDHTLTYLLELDKGHNIRLSPLMKSYFTIVVNDGYYEIENADLLAWYIQYVIEKFNLIGVSNTKF